MTGKEKLDIEEEIKRLESEICQRFGISLTDFNTSDIPMTASEVKLRQLKHSIGIY